MKAISIDTSAILNLSPAGIRALLLKAQNDYNLAPTELASLLLGRGKSKSYSTYKKWITPSNSWNRPSSAVYQKLLTLYHFFEINDDAAREYIKSRISNN